MERLRSITWGKGRKLNEDSNQKKIAFNSILDLKGTYRILVLEVYYVSYLKHCFLDMRNSAYVCTWFVMQNTIRLDLVIVNHLSHNSVYSSSPG